MNSQECFSLSGLTTLALSGGVACYFPVDSIDSLAGMPRHSRRFILGGGSNIVLDEFFDGLLLHARLRGKRLLRRDGEDWIVEAAAGEPWHEFVMWTLEQGWGGLENLALIPGTVGAAPIQNIGAYGLEAGERIVEVDSVDLHTLQTRTFSAKECAFGYRDSVFKQNGWHTEGRYLITAVRFRLPGSWQPNVRYADIEEELRKREKSRPRPSDIADAVITIRQRKLPDPAILPNAGSFFENPVVDAETAGKLQIENPRLPVYPQRDGRVKLAAGWLIEACGWKGRRLGPVGMYDRQALVLVNYGGAAARDVHNLVAAVTADVRAKFGIGLRPEPVFLGSEIG